MKAIGKGILVVLFVIGLFAASQRVRAGTMEELKTILGNTPVIYQGVCYFTGEGKFTFSHDEMKISVPCIVGMKLPENDKDHFILLFSSASRRPLALIVYHET